MQHRVAWPVIAIAPAKDRALQAAHLPFPSSQDGSLRARQEGRRPNRPLRYGG
jgi:hypothetical protein